MIQYSAMGLFRWSDMEREQMTPLVARKVIHARNLTVAHIELRQGAAVAEHSHVNEQITLLERGRLRFWLGGREILVEAGEALEIPPEVPHKVEALEDSLAIDIFAPRREDWIRGDDAYLRK